jgi:peptidoglycan-N-acetylglucosamine deacetylase
MKILTFDLEDWFHLLDLPQTANHNEWGKFESRFEFSLNQITSLLRRRNQTATFFCLGWVAEKYPNAIKNLSSQGYEIGSHSQYHSLVYKQNSYEFETELVRSLECLEQVTGVRPRLYRAPGFSITPDTYWAFPILAKHGIQIDCSVFPAHRAHGGMPNSSFSKPYRLKTVHGDIKCFPINTIRIFNRSIVFSGGGYFRILPTKLIAHLMRRSPYVMTYFHPRDFDPGQPVLDGLNWSRRIRSYSGLNGALSKLENILDLGNFLDLESADQLIDWSNAPEIFCKT